jgi:hypothetical protein
MARSLPLILMLLVQAKPAAKVTEVRLKRTPCFGRCPVDEVVLRADGTATYEGRKYVDRIGRFEGKVAKADFEKLAKLMEEKKFFDLKDDYDRPITDQSSIVTTAKRGDISKEVRDYAKSGPEELRAIEKQILKVMEGIAWDKAAEPPK